MNDTISYFIDVNKGSGPMVESDVGKTRVFKFDLLYLDDHTERFRQTNRTAVPFDYVRNNVDMSDIELTNPYCKQLHKYYLPATHLVTSCDLQNFFGKKTPSLSAFHAFIKTKTVPVADQASCKSYIPGSCFDANLLLTGVRFDLAMSSLAKRYDCPPLVMTPAEHMAIRLFSARGVTAALVAHISFMNEVRLRIGGGTVTTFIKDRPDEFRLMASNLVVEDPIDFETDVREAVCYSVRGTTTVHRPWTDIGVGCFEPAQFTGEDTMRNAAMMVYFFANLCVRCAGMGGTAANGPTLIDKGFLVRWTGDMRAFSGWNNQDFMGIRWNYSVLLSTTLCFLLKSVFESKQLFDRFPVVLPCAAMTSTGPESVRKALAVYILRQLVGNSANTFAFSHSVLNDTTYDSIKMYLIAVNRMVKTPGTTFGAASATVAAMSPKDLSDTMEQYVEGLRNLANQRLTGTDGNETYPTLTYADADDNGLSYDMVTEGLLPDADEGFYVFKGESFPLVEPVESRKRKRGGRKGRAQVEDGPEAEPIEPRRSERNGGKGRSMVEAADEIAEEDRDAVGDDAATLAAKAVRRGAAAAAEAAADPDFVAGGA